MTQTQILWAYKTIQLIWKYCQPAELQPSSGPLAMVTG